MKKRNYSKFYAIATAKGIDIGQQKEMLVAEFTGGRTTHLHEMTACEYEEMCECLQSGRSIDDLAAYKERLRKARSAVLNRLQRLGIDTTDKFFGHVNEFCLNPRIAGKPFGAMTVDELHNLIPKLESILHKKIQKSIPISFFIHPGQLSS